jgi:K+-sensing histidine kinase KdpD
MGSDAAHPPADSTGLGLAITERAFRLHGGDVAAANAREAGKPISGRRYQRTGNRYASKPLRPLTV